MVDVRDQHILYNTWDSGVRWWLGMDSPDARLIQAYVGVHPPWVGVVPTFPLAMTSRVNGQLLSPGVRARVCIWGY